MGISPANIVEDVESTFNNSGFDTIRCDTAVPRCCFDVFAYRIAKRFHHAFITKVIKNIDGLNRKHIIEMKAISHFLDALPIVIGERNRHNDLAENTIYFRMKKQITAINRDTLKNMLVEDNQPYMMATRGSFNAQIDGLKLRKKRKELNISRRSLSKSVNLSIKTIAEYERGGISNSNIEHVEKIEEVLGMKIHVPINIFDFYSKEMKDQETPANKPKYRKNKASFADDLEDMFEELEISHFWTHSSPFDILLKMPTDSQKRGKMESPIISVIFSEVDERDQRRLFLLQRLLAVLRVYGTAIVADEVDAKKIKAAGVPSIRKKELKDVKDSKELSKLVRKKQY